MKIKKFLAAVAVVAAAAVFTGCSGETSSSSTIDDRTPLDSSESSETFETSAEEPTEEETEEELVPPTAAECDDPNAVDFFDCDFSFADVNLDDPDSAQGELQIVEYDGNAMLAFVDSGTNFADGTVQKIKFDAAKLLSPENLAKVRTIELDAYATATADSYVNEDKENVKAPGWIGGGGGANVSGDKWYEFGEWEGGEYNFEKSGPVHIELKFLLAEGGKCWDETMTEAVFQIMRWGAQNEGDFMVDNIVFKDEDGNSLPIEKPGVGDEIDTETDGDELTPGAMAR